MPSHFRMDGGRPRESLRVVVRHVDAVQSTIQWEIGVTAVKIEFAIGGHSERTRRGHMVFAHPIGVKWGRKYSTISTVCKCESLSFFIQPFCWEMFLVCESRANQALAQAHPVDTLHLTSLYIYIYRQHRCCTD